MHDLANLWLGSLYVLTFGVCFAAVAWTERHAGGRPVFVFPPMSDVAQSTALEALSTMRGLVHQIGNNAHELALQFDLALNTTDAQKQEEVREMLRISLHRFIDITHQVAQLDSRLSGCLPTDPPHRAH
jgi:cytochrome b561